MTTFLCEVPDEVFALLLSGPPVDADVAHDIAEHTAVELALRRMRAPVLDLDETTVRRLQLLLAR